MIRCGFLSPRQRAELIALLRDGRTAQRLARRANALLLLDDGWSCERAAKALYLDHDTIRGWRKTYDEAGVEGLRRFEAGGSASLLSQAQEEELFVYVSQALPRSTREVGVFIEQVFGGHYHVAKGRARRFSTSRNFRLPRRPRAMCSSPQCVAGGVIELT